MIRISSAAITGKGTMEKGITEDIAGKINMVVMEMADVIKRDSKKVLSVNNTIYEKRDLFT